MIARRSGWVGYGTDQRAGRGDQDCRQQVSRYRSLARRQRFLRTTAPSNVHAERVKIDFAKCMLMFFPAGKQLHSESTGSLSLQGLWLLSHSLNGVSMLTGPTRWVEPADQGMSP